MTHGLRRMNSERVYSESDLARWYRITNAREAYESGHLKASEVGSKGAGDGWLRFLEGDVLDWLRVGAPRE